MFLKRLRILIWWYSISKNEFHYSLNYSIQHNVKEVEKLITRREIFHLLDTGYNVWELSEYLVEKF